ncbi:S-adenosyl-L-methionine-dependent methyltransferase [Pestalotiopsis sp. NC0098]|nr:S-adenosyl-L-methionine-dependent methyltransferase [Pestalotiopsis sp. NC0098]
MATQSGIDGGKSPLKPQDNSGVTSASTNESPPLAIDAPSPLPSLATHQSQENGHVSDQEASGIDADPSSLPLQSSTPADDDAELEWTPDLDPMTPESLPNEETVTATGTYVETGASGGDTAREAPLSPKESGAAVTVGSRELQSPDASARCTQDPEPHGDPPVSESAQPEASPQVYGFVPDEPLEVDERLLKYAASRANVSASHAVDSQSWIPEDFLRQPTGSTIAEPESVLGRSGRTYHGFKEGKYFMPNDGQEQDRLDFQHRALTILIDERLHAAPIQSPKYVMDIATGTGIWAMEFAQQYPDSKVIGVDLSKIQPKNAPPNVEFIKDDSEEPWVFPYKFDFVHARAVFTCFNDQKAVMRNAFENLNEGGWIEYLDGSFIVGCLDGTIEGTALKRWGELLVEGGLALGRDLEVTKHFKQWLEETGFVDVVERKLPWAYSPWPQDRRLKLAGKFMQSNIYEGIRGISFMFLTGAGLTEPEINQMILDVRADLMNPRIHGFMPVWSVYGRKPFNHEEKPRQA